MVQAAGLFRKTRVQNMIQAAILLLGGIVLGKVWGIYGILIASILSNGYRCVDLAIFVPRNVTFDSPWKSFRRVLILGITTSVAYLMAHWVVQKIEISNYFEWAIIATIVFIYSFTVIVLVDCIFEKKNFKASVNRFSTLLKWGRKK